MLTVACLTVAVVIVIPACYLAVAASPPGGAESIDALWIYLAAELGLVAILAG